MIYWHERAVKVCNRSKSLAVLSGVLLQPIQSNISVSLLSLNYINMSFCTFFKYYKTWYPLCCEKTTDTLSTECLLVARTPSVMWDCIFEFTFSSKKLSSCTQRLFHNVNWSIVNGDDWDIHFKSTFLLQTKMLTCIHISDFSLLFRIVIKPTGLIYNFEIHFSWQKGFKNLFNCSACIFFAVKSGSLEYEQL